MAAAASVEVDRWQAELSEVMIRIGGRFGRREPRVHAGSFLFGLLAVAGVRNCWTLAEHAGHASPAALQHLLARARWDEDGVRDDLRGYVVEHLADPADRVGMVLVADETGDLKKGNATVGVQRQYTGTAGRIENAQVGVYLVVASSRGHAFIDRELYLPKVWAGDARRRADAGVPDDVEFATKPALAVAMLERALDDAVPARWFAGDEVYGQDPALRARLRSRGLGYVVAVASSHQVRTGIGARRAVDLAVRAHLPWHRLSAGAGARGHRWYDWALIDLDPADRDHDQHGGRHALLVRRNTATGELAFYRTWTPEPVPLATLVTVAGRRWTIEESFQSGKGLTGLDEHQVRRWTSWRRWTVLAMLAHAVLSVITATTPQSAAGESGPGRLTRNEVRRLICILLAPAHLTTKHAVHWSLWRRRAQARARVSHYQRQAAALNQ